MPKATDFWSRRRRAVAAETETQARQEGEALRAETEEALEAVDDESLLEMLGLPDPETLTPADAARFMAREVPSRLRKRALRALFKGHPGLSVPDGLLDYDDDYRVAPLGPRPARQVWTAITRVVEALPDPDEAPDPATAAIPEDPAPDDQAPDDATGHAPDDGAEMRVADTQPGDQPEDLALRPRRMTFRFEETDT